MVVVASASTGHIVSSGPEPSCARFLGERPWSVPRQEKATLEGHAFDVYNLAFSPDDRTLASSDGPTTDVADVKLWDVARGRARYTMRRNTTGSPIAFSADGRLLATGWGHVFYLPAGLTLVDVATGQERLTLTSGIPAVARAVAFSPDGTTVALVVSWGQIFLSGMCTPASCVTA